MSYFEQYETNLKQIELREVSAKSTVSNQEFTNSQITVSSEEILPILVGIAAISWVLAVCKRLGFRKTGTDESTKIGRHFQAPCSKCQYYHSNIYLKCAVHPSKVLSKEAIDCPDYTPKNNNHSSD